MSRNYELLRQLEESSPINGDPSPPSKADDWSQVSVGPSTDEPFYTPRPKVSEFPLRQVPRPKHSASANEEIARLIESLVLSQNGRELRSIVFCEIEDNGASGYVCAQAGLGLAARSESVCLVDTNVRAKNLSRYLGISPDVLWKGGPALVKDRCTQLETNLWFAGPDLINNDSGGLLQVDEIANVLGRLRASFHYVLFDTQSISASREAALFGNLADGAVLVIEAGVTRKHAARKAKEFLEAAAVPLVGTILNNRAFPIPESLYKHL